jgi:hypothetical protein
MKQIIASIIFIIICNRSYSQIINLEEFNKQQVSITKNGMAVLSSWGAVNLIYSGIPIGSAAGSDKSFYQMNLIWGGVNFSLGAIGYLFSKSHNGLGYTQSLKKQMSIEKAFLFNTGLDLAYVAGGFYLKEKANNNNVNHDRNKGYGESIILQGASLFLFDGIMYFINQAHGKRLYKLADKIQIGTTLNGVGLIVIL